MQEYHLCPCDSGRLYSSCCEPFISGAALPPAAEQLMRSRYTAYVAQAVDYILETWHPSTRPPAIEADSLIVWKQLRVMRTEKGGERDQSGTVEFVAKAADGRELHEVSNFVKQEGRWFYLDGVLMNEPLTTGDAARPITVRKVGRNEPCPCGSGKKYKKCCGGG